MLNTSEFFEAQRAAAKLAASSGIPFEEAAASIIRDKEKENKQKEKERRMLLDRMEVGANTLVNAINTISSSL